MKESDLRLWTGRYDGHTMLGSVWCLVFFCAGYFTFNISITIKIISGLFLIAHTSGLIIYRDKIKMEMQKKRGPVQRSAKVRWGSRLVSLAAIMIAVMVITIPIVPIYIKGIVTACVYHIISRLSYKKIEPTKGE